MPNREGFSLAVFYSLIHIQLIYPKPYACPKLVMQVCDCGDLYNAHAVGITDKAIVVHDFGLICT